MSKPARIGLWKNSSDRGPIASGNCGGIRFVIWRNDKKGNDKAPDFHLVIEAAERREDRGDDRDSQPTEQRGGFPNDEIPF